MDQQPVEQFHDILEDEDYCEDGYSTAKSFRLCSVSTCTATTVLAHMYRNKLRGKRGDATVFIDITRVPQDAKDEHWNIPIMAEYGDEILDFMRDLEARMVLNPRYMDQQIELQWSMRAILVDWVIRVHGRVNLLPETLFLAVNYVDHFLSCKIISPSKLQLVGATAIFIAAKYEEVQCPPIDQVIYMAAGTSLRRTCSRLNATCSGSCSSSSVGQVR
ncbi:B-type cyclin [Elasticomyces elasticus]|nr:B-type cyclin [Elasticomyces elasticus]